jgi:hypothetical protein
MSHKFPYNWNLSDGYSSKNIFAMVKQIGLK